MPDFKDITDRVHKMALDMEHTQQSAHQVDLSLRSMFTSAMYNQGIKYLGEFVTQTRLWQSVNASLTRGNLDRNKLLETETDLMAVMSNYDLLRLVNGNKLTLTEGLHENHYRRQLNLARSQLALEREFEKVGNMRIALTLAAAGAMGALYYSTRQLNQSLIEANSQLSYRRKLLQDTLVTQVQLGASFGQATQAAAALVHYGLDTEKSFVKNLKLVVQMEQGLGIAVSQSAQLASIVERQLKGSFESVAHSIAQIVEDTALAGEEAMRLANTIAVAMGRLKPGLSATTLPEVVRLVGRYESALKEIGGQSGAFQQLLAQLTTPEGLTGAGALGVSPEFLATSRGVQDVMDRFARFGEMLVGQAEGWERQMRLQALAQIFSVSADQANQMLMAVHRANEAQMGQITAQERWRNQMEATNSGIIRLYNSLTGLLQGGMYPFVYVIGEVTNTVANWVEALLQAKEVVYGIGGMVAAGTVLLSMRMYSLARALAHTVITSTAAQAALTRLNAHLAAQSLATSAPALHSLGGIITSGFRLVLSPYGVLLGVIAGAVVGIYSWWRRYGEDQKNQEQIILHRQQTLDEKRRQMLYGARRYGEAEDVINQYRHLVVDAVSQYAHIRDPKQRMEAQKQWLDDELNKALVSIHQAKTARMIFTPLSDRTQEDRRREDRMEQLAVDLLEINKVQKTLLERRMKEDMERANEERDNVDLDHAKFRMLEDRRNRGLPFPTTKW